MHFFGSMLGSDTHLQSFALRPTHIDRTCHVLQLLLFFYLTAASLELEGFYMIFFYQVNNVS